MVEKRSNLRAVLLTVTALKIKRHRTQCVLAENFLLELLEFQTKVSFLIPVLSHIVRTGRQVKILH